MDLEKLRKALSSVKTHELPGRSAQFRMAPAGRKEREKREFKPDSYKSAAVLIMLYETEQGIYFPLTQRQQYGGSHSGQVSLPGGKPEEQDNSLFHTALRETEEEIGVQSSNIEHLCELSPLFIPPSGYLVTPFVGICNAKPVFKLEEREVKEILPTALDFLMDESFIQETTISLGNGMRIQTPFYHWHSRTVWGATAMILSEFHALIKQKSPDS